jgi:hypothetical protein
MPPPHTVLLVCSIAGLFASLVLSRALDNRAIEERGQSLSGFNLQITEYHLKERCPTAEELHSSLSGILKEHGIIRVRSGFYSYDLLYFIKPGKWFGFTFYEDYRDDYIDVKLGELYQIRDPIPRLIIPGGKTIKLTATTSLIIVGEYTENLKKLNVEGIINSKIPLLKKNAYKNIKDTVRIIENTFEAVVKNIDIEVEHTEKKRLTPHLIKELPTFEELKQIDKNAITEDI